MVGNPGLLFAPVWCCGEGGAGPWRRFLHAERTAGRLAVTPTSHHRRVTRIVATEPDHPAPKPTPGGYGRPASVPAPGYGPAAYPPAPPAPYGNQGYPQQPPPYGWYAMQQPRTNTLAIVAFVSTFFVSLAGVVMGHLALGQIKRTGESGRGLAIAALVLGYAGIVLGATFLLVFIAAYSARY